DPSAGRTPLPLPRRASHRPDGEAAPDDRERSAARRAARALDEVASDGIADLSRPRPRDAKAAETDARDAPPPAVEDVPAPTDVAALLVASSVVAGTLSAALVLVGPSPIALTARVVLVLVATGAFVAHAFTTVRDAGDLHPVASAAAPVGAAVATLAA